MVGGGGDLIVIQSLFKRGLESERERERERERESSGKASQTRGCRLTFGGHYVSGRDFLSSGNAFIGNSLAVESSKVTIVMPTTW